MAPLLGHLVRGSQPLKLRPFLTCAGVHGKPQTVTENSAANRIGGHGFPTPLYLHEIVQKNPFLPQIPSPDLHCSSKLLQSFGFSESSFLSIISACPRILDLQFLRKWHLGFHELGLFNAAPVSTLHAILEQSAKFRIDPEDFLHKSRLMVTAGFSAETLVKVFEELPAAFLRDGIDVCGGIEFLKETIRIVHNKEEINIISSSYPEFLAFTVDGRLRPLFSELSDLGFDRIEVRTLLTQKPRVLLGMEPGELSCCMNLLQGLKCRALIKKRVLASGRLRAAISVKLRVDFLCGHGLIRRDAFKVLHVEPRSILYSLEDLDKKIQFLVQKLGFSISHLPVYPDYLGMNLEKQISPRLQVVELLKSKGAIEMEVELKHFVRLSRRKFYNFFVKPYPECENIFGGLIRGAGIQEEKLKAM